MVMRSANGLPRGIYYEESKRRYRVRLYKNKVPHLKGYYRTLEDALIGLAELKERIESIPKVTKDGPVPSADLFGIISAIRDRQLVDPNLLRRKRLQ